MVNIGYLKVVNHFNWRPQPASALLLICSRTSVKGDSCCPCIPSCFPEQRPLVFVLLLPFQEQNIDTFHVSSVHFPSPSISFRDALLHYASPLPQFQWLFTLLRQFFIIALLTQIDCVGFTTFRRCLPVPDGFFFTASIVAPKSGPSWFTKGAIHFHFRFLLLCLS